MSGSVSTTLKRWTLVAGLAVTVLACNDDDYTTGPTDDPNNAPKASIDRFSDAAGTLFKRSVTATLPAANAPIDMDVAPFVTQGLGPDGRVVRYYNFDVMPEDPAPIYLLYREGEMQPVAGQRNIVDVIPGDPGYSDFWQVVRVTVPKNYVANTVRSRAQIVAAGYPMQETNAVVNCPIVPEGSTADEGDGADGLVRGWYRGQQVFYFNFGEAALTTTAGGSVPTSPIFVTFNTNPDEPNGGPLSGFRTETGTDQTHNVVATLPGQQGYSPLWMVISYDNADFDAVSDLQSAQAATIFGVEGLVNCPIVFVEP